MNPPKGGDNKNIILLSKHFQLTTPQTTLLNKGLTFIPTPKPVRNHRQLHLDLQMYHRRIKLALFFEEEEREPIPFTLPSEWTPKDSQLPDAIKQLIKEDSKELKNVPTQYMEEANITPEETIALKQLTTNHQIVIKPADKGSAIVIMDKDQYLTEAYNQLNNPEYYRKLSEPVYPQTIPKIQLILENLKAKKFINQKQYTYLRGNTPVRPRRFYILPKIHKDPTTWTVPHTIPPGRPIVSDVNSESYHTAEYIEHYLTPISIKHPSYIKDTYHFIETIKNITIPPTAYLFTMDINSLYTNIDTTEGLTAIKTFFHKYPDKKRPDKELLQLLEINLNYNDFEFNADYYLQVKGTAMGKKFAPAYANIFMANWEEGALAKSPKKPLRYYRYLDDIFGIWTHSTQDFTQFTEILNNHSPSIKLKTHLHPNTVDFLDTTIYKGDTFYNTGRLDTKVYFKDTDTHALLHKTSFHPKHTFRGLVKSQLLRFHRISTQPKDFHLATKTLFSALRQRGYSRPFLRNCLKTFKHQTPQTTEAIIPLITTYSSPNVRFSRKIKLNFKTTLQEQGLLPDHKIIAAHRRNKNLQDYLVHAKIKTNTQHTPKYRTDCFPHTKWIYDSDKTHIYHIPHHYLPTTKNVIYLIWCNQCRKQYVGETGNQLTVRLTQHRYNIKTRKQTHLPIVQHFITHGLTQLKCTIIRHDPSWTTSQRRGQERYWIHKLKTREPTGLNIKH